MAKECVDCSRETWNAPWIDGQYLPLCFACEERRERPAGPAGQIAGWDVPADPLIDGEAGEDHEP